MTAVPKFQIRLIDDLGGPKELLALGVLAEELGYDSVMYPHSTFRLNSWVLNSALSQLTKRIELSCGGSIYTADPSELATYAATLDDVSQGRVNLRLGAHNYDTLTWTGMKGDDMVQRVREADDIIRRLLRGERVAYQGKIYRWTDKAYLRVKPYRSEIPVFITPVGDELLELSGEIGDGVFPMVSPPEAASVVMQPILRGLRRSKKPSRSFESIAYVWIAVSEDGKGMGDLLADIVAYYGSFQDARALATLGLTVEDFEPAYDRIMNRDREGARKALTPQMLRIGIAGTPEECIKRLEVIFHAGFTGVSLGGPLGREPAEAMRLIAQQVMPAFK